MWQWWLCIAVFASGCTEETKYVFTTKLSYRGNLGGLSGADSKCALAAQAAGLGGTFVALLSTSTSNMVDRIDDVGPWYLRNGTLVLNNRAGIATTPVTALGVNENGESLGQRECAWTGSVIGGTAATETCADWTAEDNGTLGRSGNTNASDSHWIDAGGGDCAPSSCSLVSHLYCMQQ